MVWHRTDDGFPEHVKSDALAAHFGDDWATLNLAFTAWHHMGCDCAARRTDGAFNALRAYRVLRAPRAAIDAALAGLVAVRLLERVADGFVFHDWADYQPTKAQLDAERDAKTQRQARWRANKPKPVDVEETHVRHDVDGAVDASTQASVDASRDGRVDAAPTRPVPTQPKEDISKPPRAKKAADPPPFSVADALDALASTAGRRFVVGDKATWAKGWVFALQGLVRQFPSLDDWRLVGAWLAAGFGGGLPTATFGVRWAASGALPDAMAKARAWDADGRPAAFDERGFPVRAVVEAPDPWAAAMKRGVVQ